MLNNGTLSFSLLLNIYQGYSMSGYIFESYLKKIVLHFGAKLTPGLTIIIAILT
ncbi:hypothetical protein MS10495_A0037 (plasmid) [Escherichia coli]